ncbi:hypothetical protein MICRO8M_30149 [Microbacterium sp. 8M]|nr:hypothetical protein MICRO8M_30149 [Microbacterium sp. 8M]
MVLGREVAVAVLAELGDERVVALALGLQPAPRLILRRHIVIRRRDLIGVRSGRRRRIQVVVPDAGVLRVRPLPLRLSGIVAGIRLGRGVAVAQRPHRVRAVPRRCLRCRCHVPSLLLSDLRPVRPRPRVPPV